MDLNTVLSSFLNQLLIALVVLAGPPIIAWTVGKLKEVWIMFKGYAPDIAEMFEEAVPYAVDAAESSGLLDLTLEKLNFAIESATNYIYLKWKIKIEGPKVLKMLTDMIEAYLLNRQLEFMEIAEAKRAEKSAKTPPRPIMAVKRPAPKV